MVEFDYYPGGMDMPGRTYTTGNSYRYSINGQEKTPEIASNTTTAEYWQYDARIVKRWNVDPRPNISISPYNCFAGNPVWMADHLGDTTIRGQKMEPNSAEHATYLENVTVRSTKPNPVKQMYLDAIKTSPSLVETLKEVVPWDKVGKMTSDQLRKFFIKSLDEFPQAHRSFATAYFNKGFNRMNKIVGSISDHLVFTHFLEYALALANGQTAPLPDPTGLSGMIVTNVSVDVDEDLVNMAVKRTMLGTITPDALGRTLMSVSRRGHGINVSGTYVSPGELTDIYLNGGVVNTNYLQFPNHGFGVTPPTKDGLRYSIFILYNDKTTIPIRNYELR